VKNNINILCELFAEMGIANITTDDLNLLKALDRIQPAP
jgi:hypothetical protein